MQSKKCHSICMLTCACDKGKTIAIKNRFWRGKNKKVFNFRYPEGPEGAFIFCVDNGFPVNSQASTSIFNTSGRDLDTLKQSQSKWAFPIESREAFSFRFSAMAWNGALLRRKLKNGLNSVCFTRRLNYASLTSRLLSCWRVYDFGNWCQRNVKIVNFFSFSLGDVVVVCHCSASLGTCLTDVDEKTLFFYMTNLFIER